MKTCTVCNIEKDLDDFGMDKNCSSGKRVICKDCVNKKRYIERQHPREKLIVVYDCMVARCYDPNDDSFSSYGARGISVCEEWLMEREDFIIWALDHGWEPGLDLHRIDNDDDYCPVNCIFLTNKEHVRISSNTILTKDQVAYIKYAIMFIPIKELAKQFGVNRSTITDIEAGRSWLDVDPRSIDPRSVDPRSIDPRSEGTCSMKEVQNA